MLVANAACVLVLSNAACVLVLSNAACVLVLSNAACVLVLSKLLYCPCSLICNVLTDGIFLQLDSFIITIFHYAAQC